MYKTEVSLNVLKLEEPGELVLRLDEKVKKLTLSLVGGKLRTETQNDTANWVKDRKIGREEKPKFVTRKLDVVSILEISKAPPYPVICPCVVVINGAPHVAG